MQPTIKIDGRTYRTKIKDGRELFYIPKRGWFETPRQRMLDDVTYARYKVRQHINEIRKLNRQFSIALPRFGYLTGEPPLWLKANVADLRGSWIWYRRKQLIARTA